MRVVNNLYIDFVLRDIVVRELFSFELKCVARSVVFYRVDLVV